MIQVMTRDHAAGELTAVWRLATPPRSSTETVKLGEPGSGFTSRVYPSSVVRNRLRRPQEALLRAILTLP